MTDDFIQVRDFQTRQRQTCETRKLINHRLQPGNFARNRFRAFVNHCELRAAHCRLPPITNLTVRTLLVAIRRGPPVTLSDAFR